MRGYITFENTDGKLIRIRADTVVAMNPITLDECFIRTEHSSFRTNEDYDTLLEDHEKALTELA